MSTIEDHYRTLPDEVTQLVNVRPNNSDEVYASLKSLLKKFSATPHNESVGEALQLLGTAVGKQSKHLSNLGSLSNGDQRHGKSLSEKQVYLTMCCKTWVM